MSTPQDPHRDDGLSEDERAFERALAARLARAGGPREPSAALDAAILAAARVAVSTDAVALAAASPSPSPAQTPTDVPAKRSTVVALPPRKPKPRWPLGLSLAASLVLAAGIGIKLYDGGLSHDTAASAEAVADSAAAYEQAPEPLAEAILIDPPMQRESPPPPPPLEDAAAQAKRVARGNSAEFATAPQASAAAEADAAASDMGAMDQAVPAPPPPPVATRMAEPARQGAAGEEGSLDRVEVTGSRIGDARNVGAAEHTRTPLSERRREATDAARAAEAQREAAKAESQRRQDNAERRALAAPPPPPPPAPVAASPAPRPAPAASAPPPAGARGAAGSGYAAEPPADKAAAEAEAADALYDDRPPVTADSPEFRQAWLQRIRKLVTDGRRSEARASLQEFRRRYPDVVVPDDLRPLLTPEPSPPTP